MSAALRPLLWPLSAAALLMLVLSAGDIRVSHAADASSQSTQPVPASGDRVIVPGERVGPLQLAGKIADVERLVGPGAVRGSGMWGFSKLQTWDAIGLWVDFDPGTGNVFWISVDTGGSNPWIAHSTAEGIGLGASEPDVISRMGPPERIVSEGGAKSLYYDRRGIRLTFFESGPLAGKIGSLRIVWPSIPKGDTTIVPGGRISGIELGAPIEKVLPVLGGGYHSGQGSPGHLVYYWPHLGLSLVERSGHVISVRAGSHIATDAFGLRYSTAENLGRDSTASDVQRVLGAPAEPAKGQPLRWMVFRDRGIAFALDEGQKVKLVDVFAAKR